MAGSKKPGTMRLSRRALLRGLAGSAAAAASLPVWGSAVASFRPLAGRGENRAGKFFSAKQMETLDAITEVIIPADDHSPGARAAQVALYIDTVVSEGGAKQKDRWTKGLAAMDRLAQAACGKDFARCSPADQKGLIENLSHDEVHPASLEERFFVEVKRATVRGYYTSAIGIHQDLQYQGNTALEDFPGCTMPQGKAGKG